MKINLDAQVRRSCRHLLSEINRDPASPTLGCFDRRYWAWKMTDFPEATFQRNLANLGWYMKNGEGESDSRMIPDAVIAGLLFTSRIQHRDGSFDQAFPFERSFGATGFLLPDLIKAYLAVKAACSEEEKTQIKGLLQRATDFLCRSAEKHGLISNHLAGAAYGLLLAFDLFGDDRFEKRAWGLVDQVVSNQSPEGWFPEYGGADPGYQTLCMHYLAQIYRLSPTEEMKQALQGSLDFLQFFVHPDGSFGGEYGSRRTEIFYPGGIALLADEFPVASIINSAMRQSIEHLNTVTLVDIDMGNIAPLLSSTILALESTPKNNGVGRLPFENEKLVKTFSQAGIAVFGNSRYYALMGASNGGVLKVFDKNSRQLVADDCGALAEIRNGEWISTQSTRLTNPLTIGNNVYKMESGFFEVSRQQTTPFNYLILRILNLTFMRIGFLNEWLKKMMVSWLVRTDHSFPLSRERTVNFSENAIEINDRYKRSGNLLLSKLFDGGKFTAIHMASSRYFSGSGLDQQLHPLDYQSLNREGKLETNRTIDLHEGKS